MKMRNPSFSHIQSHFIQTCQFANCSSFEIKILDGHIYSLSWVFSSLPVKEAFLLAEVATHEAWFDQKTHLRKRCGFYIRKNSALFEPFVSFICFQVKFLFLNFININLSFELRLWLKFGKLEGYVFLVFENSPSQSFIWASTGLLASLLRGSKSIKYLS